MSICVDCSCSLCCDGTLYSWAPLKEEDHPILAGRFEVIHEKRKAEDGKSEAGFKLPCSLCLENKCSIHEEQRPAICGDYQCKLVGIHEAGKISTDEARALIANIKKIRDRLRPQMEELVQESGNVPFVDLTLMVANKHEKMDATERMAISPAMLLDMALIRVLLAKNFDSRLTRYTYEAYKSMAMQKEKAMPATEPGE